MRPPREGRTRLHILAFGALSSFAVGHGEAREAAAQAEIRYRFVIDVQIDPDDKPPAGVKRRELTAGLVAKLRTAVPDNVEILAIGADGKPPCAPADTCDVVTITESIDALADPAGVAFVLRIRSTKRRHRDVFIPEPDDRRTCEDHQQIARSWFDCPGGYVTTVAEDLDAHIRASHSAGGGGI